MQNLKVKGGGGSACRYGMMQYLCDMVHLQVCSVMIIMSFVQDEVCVDSQTADLLLEVDQLRQEIAIMKNEKCKEITTLTYEKEKAIADLQEENEKQLAKVRETLDHYRQELERVETQKQKLENEIKTHQDGGTAKDQNNQADELEMLQRELKNKQAEVEKLSRESNAAKDKHTNEIEALRAEHSRVLTDLQHEKEQTLREKEDETKHWRERSKHKEEEIATLHKELEGKNTVLRDEEESCLLPTVPIKTELKKMTDELEVAKFKLEESRKELAEKAEEANRLNYDLEEARVKHAEEMGRLKTDFDEKRKQDEQLIEQQVQNKVDKLEKASRDKRIELKTENETLREKLKSSALTLKEKEHKYETCVKSMKSNNERKQKEYENQLQQKADEIKSLNEQLNEARSKQHEVDKESQQLSQELQELESELTKVVSEKEAAQRAYDELSSHHKELKSKYEQLGVMVKLRKHEEASPAVTADWIHSSEDGVESETVPVSVVCNCCMIYIVTCTHVYGMCSTSFCWQKGIIVQQNLIWKHSTLYACMRGVIICLSISFYLGCNILTNLIAQNEVDKSHIKPTSYLSTCNRGTRIQGN